MRLSWPCGCRGFWLFASDFFHDAGSKALLFSRFVSTCAADICCCIGTSREPHCFHMCCWHLPQLINWGRTPLGFVIHDVGLKELLISSTIWFLDKGLSLVRSWASDFLYFFVTGNSVCLIIIHAYGWTTLCLLEIFLMFVFQPSSNVHSLHWGSNQ